MVTTRAARLIVCAGIILMAACGDEREAPTAVRLDATASANPSMHDAGPFTFRASLDPYTIHQLPDFLMRSKETTDIVMQRSVFAPGTGGWHVHPGPTFVYVVEGEIKLQKPGGEGGCVDTPVFGAGDAYFEVANDVHRSVVVSATPAVLVVTRFNIPVGGPISISVPDPGC